MLKSQNSKIEDAQYESLPESSTLIAYLLHDMNLIREKAKISDICLLLMK